jgi:hypothetical protein
MIASAAMERMPANYHIVLVRFDAVQSRAKPGIHASERVAERSRVARAPARSRGVRDDRLSSVE